MVKEEEDERMETSCSDMFAASLDSTIVPDHATMEASFKGDKVGRSVGLDISSNIILFPSVSRVCECQAEYEG